MAANLIFRVFKMYKPPKAVKILFIEIMCKCLFNPSRELLPSEIASLSENLLKLMKGRVKGHFSLNWEPVLLFLETIFNKPKRGIFHFPKKEEGITMFFLGKMLTKIKRFFPPESSKEIYDYLKGFIGSPQGGEDQYYEYLRYLLRTDFRVSPDNYTYWMHELLALWDINRSNLAFNETAFTLFSNLAKYVHNQ